MEYFFILLGILLISPFVLRLASSQDKKSKTKVRTIFLAVLVLQIILGFFNWEKFGMSGRSGLDLATSYPGSLLWLFFVISAIQILLLLLNTRFTNLYAAILNFVNTVILFTGLIRLSNILGFQAVSFTSIGAVFLVLFGNITGLAFINKDKNLLAKYLNLKKL